jgi:hypothetical protein
MDVSCAVLLLQAGSTGPAVVHHPCGSVCRNGRLSGCLTSAAFDL